MDSARKTWLLNRQRHLRQQCAQEGMKHHLVRELEEIYAELEGVPFTPENFSSADNREDKSHVEK